MKSATPAFVVVVLALLGAFCWFVLRPSFRQAPWLRVEAPAFAQPGRTVTLRLTLTEPGLQYLNVDLHGWTSRQQSVGAISHSATQLLGAEQPAIFQLPVPPRDDLAAVRAVIYLSPNGRWPDHTHLAMTAPIEMIADPAAADRPQKLQPLRAQDQAPDAGTPRQEIAALRYGLGFFWLGAAAAVFRLIRRLKANANPAVSQGLRVTLALSLIICLASAGVELAQVEVRVDDAIRRFAVTRGVYEQRLVPQRMVVLATAGALAALAVLVLPRLRCRRLLAGLLLNATASAFAVLSLHETDALLFATVLAVPVEQWLKLGALVLAGLGLLALRRGAHSSPAVVKSSGGVRS